MKKRLFILFLIISLLLPLVPTAQAEEKDELKAAVAAQYDAYVSSLGTPNASASTSQMLNYALKGEGAFQYLTVEDPFTVAVLNSNLFTENVVQAVSEGIKYMQTHGMNQLYMAGNCTWYEKISHFSNSAYSDGENGTYAPENRITSSLASYDNRTAEHKIPFNACDNSMVEVVGGSRTRITIQRTAVTQNEVYCNIRIVVLDDFDFNGSDNAASHLGSWLDGFLIDTYSWETSAEFKIVVPNVCTHKTGNYR